MLAQENDNMNNRSGRKSTSRGSANIIGFVLIFGLLALLLGTVSFIVPSVVGTQTDIVQQSEVKNVGDSVGQSIQEFDRHVQKNSATEGTQRVNIPDRISNSGYTVVISETEDENIYQVTTSPTNGDVVYQSTVYAESNIETTRINGGNVLIEYDSETNSMVIRNE